MKKSSFIFPAFAAVVCCQVQVAHAGAAPPPNIRGSADIQIGKLDSDLFGTSDDGYFLAGQARVQIGLSSDWGVQLDLFTDRYDLDISGLDTQTWGLGAHLYKRYSNALYGMNLSYGDTDVNGFNFDHWSTGLEGQWYFDKSTLLGQVGYTSYDKTFVDDGWYLRGKVDYYISPNLKLYGGIGLADYGFTAGGGNLDITGGELGVEYKPRDTAPWRVFGELSAYNYDFGGPADLDMRKLSVGVRVNWGDVSSSIKEDDQEGPSLQLPMSIGLNHRF